MTRYSSRCRLRGPLPRVTAIRFEMGATMRRSRRYQTIPRARALTVSEISREVRACATPVGTFMILAQFMLFGWQCSRFRIVFYRLYSPMSEAPILHIWGIERSVWPLETRQCTRSTEKNGKMIRPPIGFDASSSSVALVICDATTTIATTAVPAGGGHYSRGLDKGSVEKAYRLSSNDILTCLRTSSAARLQYDSAWLLSTDIAILKAWITPAPRSTKTKQKR